MIWATGSLRCNHKVNITCTGIVIVLRMNVTSHLHPFAFSTCCGSYVVLVSYVAFLLTRTDHSAAVLVRIKLCTWQLSSCLLFHQRPLPSRHREKRYDGSLSKESACMNGGKAGDVEACTTASRSRHDSEDQEIGRSRPLPRTAWKYPSMAPEALQLDLSHGNFIMAMGSRITIHHHSPNGHVKDRDPYHCYSKVTQLRLLVQPIASHPRRSLKVNAMATRYMCKRMRANSTRLSAGALKVQSY